MRLYQTDYTKLSEEDSMQHRLIMESQIVMRAKFIDEIPAQNKAIRHFETLFPNNYLDWEDLLDRSRLEALLEEYKNEIHKIDATESKIANWIRTNNAHFIIASILKETNFGHHEAFIIPEFKLGTLYEVDYLLIGKRSGGYEFMFVELEHPNKQITLAEGQLGKAFRDGLTQINDWVTYMEANFRSLQEILNKYVCPGKDLPKEFRDYDSTRIHYAVVAGLRKDFNEYTYRLKRDFESNQNTKILHYENLLENSYRVIEKYY
ncbi:MULTISPECIES: Shedu anti-phage system protein SduA domain-containing protein [Paenibacillus]|uniref:Shedu anti-phage system protein SduA domain-containing protein n=1 Tax=Paenibacillus TaxID=44249 RepID=UPI00096BD53A|nr:Shedu anti-phage system protein SduA domain-containing protein [Paenibacillus odorifer]OMD17269.1 hypothetical protein BJP50_16085 [Paenibacillus odorifer]